MEPNPSVVGARAWAQLLHAEVAYLLAHQGIPTLVIKGPSIALWLYVNERRESADVDLLVPPDQVAPAVQVLERHGFAPTYGGTRQGEAGGEHAVNLHRQDPTLGAHGIDLHWCFPGFDEDPEIVFADLWAQRMPGEQAGIGVWYPSLEARALVVALHAARSPGNPKTSEDLRRVVLWADQGNWPRITSMARRLRALSALKAALLTLDDPQPTLERASLVGVRASPEWTLRSHGSSRTALRIEQLTRVPRRERPQVIVKWLFPTPALMRIRDPRAAQGRWRLALAYGVRFVDGVKALPPAIGAIRRARR